MPAATAYRKVLPSMVRTGVNNFFGNIGDVWSLANNVAQLKLQNSAETFMRVNVNTFFGLGGLLDVATEAGIDRHEEDFGQTLGRWGVGAGPYVVLPLLGPVDAARHGRQAGRLLRRPAHARRRRCLAQFADGAARGRHALAVPARRPPARRRRARQVFSSRAMRSCSAAAARSTTAVRRTRTPATTRAQGPQRRPGACALASRCKASPAATGTRSAPACRIRSCAARRFPCACS
jgi:hypothetical protein